MHAKLRSQFLAILTTICTLFLTLFTLIPTLQAADLGLTIDMDASGGLIAPLNQTTDTVNGNAICPTDPTAGCDFSDSDMLIRTNDQARYLLNYSVNSGDETPTISVTLDPGLSWDTVPASCQNPVASTDTPNAGESTISTDGRTLTCYLGMVTSGTSIGIPALVTVDGDNPNGATVGIASATIDGPSSTQTAGILPSDLTVTAAPRWDLDKIRRGVVTFTHNGILGSRIQYDWRIQVWDDNGSIDPLVGNESLANTLSFSDDISQMTANSELLDCTANFEHGNEPYSTYNVANPARSVTDSGTVSCSQAGVGQTIVITQTGMDTSLSHYPTLSSTGSPLPGNVRIAAIGRVRIFVPFSDIPVGTSESLENEMINFDPQSITAQSNFGPNSEETNNNNASANVSNIPSGDFAKLYTQEVGQYGWTNPLPTATGARNGDGFASPGYEFVSFLTLTNNGSADLTNPGVCDVIDISTLEITDISGTPGAAATVNFVSGGLTSYVIEYATGYVGTWPPATLPDGEALATECSDAGITWYSDTSSVPGPITKVRIRAADPLEPGNEMRVWINHTALDNGNPNGTLIPNYGTFFANELNDGAWWEGCTYDYTNHSGNVCGDRVALARAIARIDKTTLPNDLTNEVLIGGGIGYQLTPTLTSDGNPITSSVQVFDLLPPGLTYQASTATVGGASSEPTLTSCTGSGAPDVKCTQNGETLLRWNLGDQAANSTLPTIQFTATASLDLAQATVLVNTTIIEADQDLSPESDRTDTRNISVSVPTGMLIVKEVAPTLIQSGDSYTFTIEYRNTSNNAIASTDLIDILPSVGDGTGTFAGLSEGRSPATTFGGSNTLVGLSTSSGTPTWYFTNATASTIDKSPSAASNVLPPDAGTIWCAGTAAGPDAGCGFTLAQATAVRMVNNDPLNTDDSQSITLEFDTAGNAEDDVYTNDAAATGSGLALPVLSQDVSVIVVTSSLGDTVWYDMNADGIQDPGETGIAGVVVNLVGINDLGQPVTLMDTTDANGKYNFADLRSGTYTVTVNVATLPADLTQTFDNDGTGTANQSISNLGINDDDLAQDFGYRPTGQIGDRVWYDLDGDGVQEAGEEGIPNVELILTDSGGVTQTVMTDSDGNYLFTNLFGDDYTVTVNPATLPGGLTQTYDDDGIGTADESAVTLASNNSQNLDQDFGYQPVLDYGDLPDTGAGTGSGNYNSNVNDSGAGHIVLPDGTSNKILLGATVTTETDSNQGGDAGDDGITRTSDWDNGADGGAITAEVDGSGYLVGWLDFDNDGTFDTFFAQTVVDGTNNITFDVPGGTFLVDGSLGGGNIDIYGRFRLFTSQAAAEAMAGEAMSLTAGFTGITTNGEVEDYVWTMSPTAISMLQPLAVNAMSESAFWIIVALLLLVFTAVLIYSLRNKRSDSFEPQK